MAFRQFETDLDAIVALVESAVPGMMLGERRATVYTTAGKSVTDFLTTQTTNTPALLVAYMGFGYGQGLENGPGAPMRSYSVFVNMGTPGAATTKPGKKSPTAEAVADAILATLYGRDGFGTYELAANGQPRTVRVDAGRHLFLTHGFDVFELAITIQ